MPRTAKPKAQSRIPKTVTPEILPPTDLEVRSRAVSNLVIGTLIKFHEAKGKARQTIVEKELPVAAEALANAIDEGLIVWTGKRWAPTDRGPLHGEISH